MKRFVKHLIHDKNGRTYAFFTLGYKTNPAMMILPGLTGTHEDCYALGHNLQEKHFIIIPDMPGWGSSQSLIKSNTIYNYVDFLNMIVEQMELKKVVMLGHCMGVVLCVQFGLKYPSKVDKMVLISPPYEEKSFIYSILRHTGELSLNFTPLIRPFFFIWRNRLLSFCVAVVMARFKTISKRVRFASRTLDRSTESERVVEENIYSMYKYHWKNTNRLKQELHVIHGGKDFIIPTSAVAELMTMLPAGTTLDIIEDAGHLPILETPGALATIIGRYVR